ncbi:MAG: signal recognition particle-docking protein FtsY [Methanomassiliicoccaceae archaeon]|nr:signal recognition particle-docking protein FtsY [Methanomassiliicoccaceae archaeon]
MFDSLKGKFKNIFKKEQTEGDRAEDERPKEIAEPKETAKPKEVVKPREAVKPKEKARQDDRCFDDDDFEFGDDLIEDDGTEDDLEDEDVPNDEPEVIPVREPAPPVRVAPPEPIKSVPADIPVKIDDTRKDDIEDDMEGEDVPDDEPEVIPVREPPAPPVRAAPPEPVKSAPAVHEEPVAVARPEPVTRTEPVVRDEPKAAEEDKLSKKERIKLAKLAAKDKKAAAKQERIAAKEGRIAAKEAERHESKQEDGHDDNEFVGDHGKKIKESALDGLLWELEVALMEADVALPVVEEIIRGVKDDLTGKRHTRDHTLGEVVELSVKDSISRILKINEFDFDAWLNTRSRPAVVMFVGINGTGKTTSIAKIANRLMNGGRTVVLAAADTFRAGAIEQLTIHSERLGCKIVKHAADADPAAVAFDAIEHAKAKRKDVVLVDTAGRMQTNSNLMDEMKKIRKVAKPDLVMFVGDSLAGNDAVEQAKAFDAAVGVDAIMLTKIDADSKGGAALSIAHTIGKPIAFVSNGQEYDRLVKFSAKWMMDRLFED